MFFWFFVLKRAFDYGSELFICLKEPLVPELGKSPITIFLQIFGANWSSLDPSSIPSKKHNRDQDKRFV
jgi:hypothetical protein